MGLFDLQSLDWTPAVCFVAVQASLIVMTAMSFLLGHTDGIYKFEPHTKEISSRFYELIVGGILLGWGLSMMGALISGGAQVMCILQLIPMLAATYYHHVCGGKTNVAVNVVFMAAGAYCGFVPLPEIKSVEWTSAAIFLAAYTVPTGVGGVLYLLGKTDPIYAHEPHVKAVMSRRSELQLGACLLGWVVGILAAIIAGGAQDMCILLLPGLLACTLHNDRKQNMTVIPVFAMPAAYFGFVR